MASDSSDSEFNISDNRDTISHDAGKIPPYNDDIAEIRKRFDELELLNEQNIAKELQTKLSEYVTDLKEELKDINRFRFWITLISVIMSVCLFLFIILISLNPPIWFSKLDSEFQIPLILSLGASSVFLMAILLRGVYRTRSDRNDILPDHLKQLLDVVNKQDK